MASSVLRTSLRACATALCAATLALAVPGAAGAATSYPGPQHRQFSSAQARSFLTGFYGRRGPSRAQRAHDVTRSLRRAVAANHRFDLLLCARNAPHHITVGHVVPAGGGQGRARVTTHAFGHRDRAFTAYVNLDTRRPMRVSGITCGAVR